MQTVIETAPAKEPVTALDVKRQLNIEQSFMDDDIYLAGLITASRLNAEQITQRKLITQTWLAYLEEWPDNDSLRLPFGSLQSVTSVKYYETDDTENTMSAAEYGVDTDSTVGRVVLDYGESWPTETLRPLNPIRVEFVCGYGDNGSDIPEPIRQAIKIDCADMYWRRSSETQGPRLKTIQHLLQRYRIEMRPEWL